MRKRRLTILLLVLLSPVFLLGAFLVFESVRGQIALAAYKRQLVANGEKFTFAELVSTTPEGRSNAAKVFDGIQRLQNGSVLTHDYPPCMKMTPSGRAIAAFRLDDWTGYQSGVGKTTNTWEQVATDLRTNQATLAQLRADLAAGEFSSLLDHSRGAKMTMPNLAPARSLAFWLGAETQLALREGRNQDAVDNLVSFTRIPQVLAGDCILISELVRIAISAIAKSYTWEALQADGWTDDQLEQLQRAWEDKEFIGQMSRSLEGERAYGLASLQTARRSNEDAVEMLFFGEDLGFLFGDETERPWWRRYLSKETYCRIWRFAWVDQTELRYLVGMQSLIDAARTAVKKTSELNLQDSEKLFLEKLGSSGFYDELRFPQNFALEAISKVISRAVCGETDRSMAICAIAIKRYELRHGQPPPSLDALVPEFLSSVPTDYMDGKPMKYRVNSDGSYTLYSVGTDRKDDNGDTTMREGKSGSWNIWNRRDHVWPLPALTDEVEAWRKEEAGK